VSIERKILKVLTHSVVRLVFPSGQIVKRVMRDRIYSRRDARTQTQACPRPLVIAVKLGDEAGFFHLFDEAEIHKILQFDLGRP
jgi:hypothetical protein